MNFVAKTTALGAVLAIAVAMGPRSYGGEPKPVVYVNHILVTPDAATFSAIKSSAFLHDRFGAMEERTTIRTDSTYHGLYFYGDNTYFEITQSRKDWPVGATMVGLSVDNAPALQLLQAQFTKTLSQPGKLEPVTREAASGKQVPWFTALTVPHDTGDKAGFFVLAYDPQFLEQWYPNFPPSSTATTRSAILDRYVSKIGQVKARTDGLIEDVDEVVFSGSTPAKLCNALNAQITPARTVGASSCGLNGVALTFSGEGTMQVCMIHFRLRRDTKEQTISLGASRLHLAGRQATWIFCKA